jgi:hypothetical protein
VVYGVPPERVIGSSIETKFEIRDGKPVLLRLPGWTVVRMKDDWKQVFPSEPGPVTGWAGSAPLRRNSMDGA